MGAESMKYDLTINQHNIKPHLDIERDIQKQKEGLYTFSIKVNQGNIEDYAKIYTVTRTEYRSVIFSVIQEPTTPRDTGTSGEENAIRPGIR